MNEKKAADNKTADSSSIYTKTIFVWAGALISCFLWGSAFPMIKLGYKEFSIGAGEQATQILFAGIRFVIAGILAVAIGCIIQKRMLVPKAGSLPMILKLSMFQTVGQYVLFYIGLAHTTGVRASIVTGTNVFAAIVVASLIFRQEKLTSRKTLGCVIGFLGVIVVNLAGTGLGEGDLVRGDLLILLSTFAYAFSSVLSKEYSKKEEPIILSGYQFFLGGLIMIAAGLLMGGRIQNVTPLGVVYLIYLAFVSAAAYSIWVFLIKYNPVSRVAVFGFMTPVFGVTTSILLLEEGSHFSLLHLVSLILVSAGILIVNSKQSRS